MTSAIQRGDSADECIDGFVDVLEMRAEAQDRAAQAKTAVDARAAEHYAAFLLEMADQAFVEFVDVAAPRKITEGDNGEIGLRPRIPAVELGQAGMKIAGERQLLRLGRAESGDPGDLQRQPEAKRAEMARQLGRKVGGRRTNVGLAEWADIFRASAKGVE